MKYRTYSAQIGRRLCLFFSLGFFACSHSPDRGDGSSPGRESARQDSSSPAGTDDGREPASMKGDFTWLQDVETEFGRVASETSSRAVASQNRHEMLAKGKEWSFSFLPRTNRFYVSLHGSQYALVPTSLDGGDRFSFAAEGQSDNPLTFAVSRGEGRQVASGESCATEISFWNAKSRSYATEKISLKGNSCSRLLGLLKEYVP